MAALALNERSYGIDAVELHARIVSLQINSIVRLDVLGQLQYGHRIQDSAGLQRCVIPEVRGFLSGQELGKDELSDLSSFNLSMVSIYSLLQNRTVLKQGTLRNH
jgi:hypothetical protein